MGKIEWAMWANEQALVSSAVALLGGLLAVFGQFKHWQFGIYTIIIAVLVAVLEYPRGKRQKGPNSGEIRTEVFRQCILGMVNLSDPIPLDWIGLDPSSRTVCAHCRGQFCFTAIVRQGRLLTRNYFIRFVFYLVISVACCFHLSTLLGGVCFIITSIIYMVLLSAAVYPIQAQPSSGQLVPIIAGTDHFIKAALKGEEWVPVEREEETTGPRVIPQPSNPPPRRPPPATNQL